MKDDITRRDFVKATGAAAVAAAGLSLQSSQAQAIALRPATSERPGKKDIYIPKDVIPGMSKQATGLKLYVESEYAPPVNASSVQLCSIF